MIINLSILKENVQLERANVQQRKNEITFSFRNVFAQQHARLFPSVLSDFYLKLEAQEIICLFFVELLKREHVTNIPFSSSDVKAMYVVRDQLTADLSIPPNLPLLTNVSNMGKSKMSRLFRKIFGSSIYQS